MNTKITRKVEERNEIFKKRRKRRREDKERWRRYRREDEGWKGIRLDKAELLLSHLIDVVKKYSEKFHA